MNFLTSRFFIYPVVVVSVFSIYLSVGGFKSEVSAVGNVLSSYFYYIYANTHDDVPTYYAHHFNTITDPELKKFYKKLVWKRSDKLLDYYSIRDTTWQLYNLDGTIRHNYLAYWQTIRPAMQQFYIQNIPPVTIKDPIVHFRCSDSPFNLQPMYHLTKARTVKWMAAQVKARGYNKVIMLACNKHRREKSNPCKQFADYYASIFKDIGIQVVQQCHSIYKDFALMIHTPLLISLNTSSYSFMAGIAKDPNNFISCNVGLEYRGEYFLQNQADWLQATEPPLLHSQVKNYYDVKEVISKLND